MTKLVIGLAVVVVVVLIIVILAARNMRAEHPKGAAQRSGGRNMAGTGMTGVTRTTAADRPGTLLATAGPACSKMTGRGGLPAVAAPARAGPLHPPVA